MNWMDGWMETRAVLRRTGLLDLPFNWRSVAWQTGIVGLRVKVLGLLWEMGRE